MRLSNGKPFSHKSCLDFDEACRIFVETWERKRDETRQVPAPKAKRNPTVPEAVNAPEQLLRWLGIEPEDIRSADVDPTIEAMAEDILSGRADWLGLDDG
jgi:hypothetical protein